MEVIRAKTAGFCMGVSLALQKLDTALSEAASTPAGEARGRIRTLGPIIHNPQVLARYEAKGVLCVRDAAELQSGDRVIIRAHGIPRQVEERVRACGALVVDATCPKVKKAQLAIARATRQGATLLLFGEADHPEVRGLISYAHGPAHVFGSQEELNRLRLNPARAHVLASQTTQDRNTFSSLEAALRARFPGLTVLSTICDATRERQEEARSIASSVDVMVIVGGRQSGNTRRLADVAALGGIDTFHVESADELDAKRFAQKTRAGLTAGASTPKSLIDAAENWLASL
ncbi:4-hydroxy-3-methylbut-2-enyl diphosphate reductase [uncultured Desulfovibrio sp.]|uniref:4-hydroxy-3-methylbut-2-enyl diphosphate reductase n=1 Tax=uncultured Desulfovibrio sp. TaxID=167968 RepID=UPI0026195D8C|nr:4-hydroxy-3-methylbut-2-enyl diphosphate reductase [uncultured Desulfovibrio sp.]